MRHTMKIVLGAAFAIALSGHANAQSIPGGGDSNTVVNNPPPGGTVVLDLQGQPIPTDQNYVLYTATFTATNTTSFLTFAFRNDPGYFAFDNASVVDSSIGSTSNLLLNGGFEAGVDPITGVPVGWNYYTDQTLIGTSTGGSVSTGFDVLTSQEGNAFWLDSATGAYDAIYQSFSTTIGDQYTVSFFLANDDVSGTDPNKYQALASAGAPGSYNGDGVDVITYSPDAIPEPASLVLVGAGLLGLGFARRRMA